MRSHSPQLTTDEPTSIIDSDMHICTRCGEKYDSTDIEPPDNASVYWTPSCPVCNTDITETTVDQTWLDISGSHLEKDRDVDYEYDYERHRKRVHCHARLYHGRLADMTVDELIERARWFDSRVSHSHSFAPEFNRDVAFALRRQARNMILEESE